MSTSFLSFAGEVEVPYIWSKQEHAEWILHDREDCWEQLYTSLSQSLNLISFILPFDDGEQSTKQAFSLCSVVCCFPLLQSIGIDTSVLHAKHFLGILRSIPVPVASWFSHEHFIMYLSAQLKFKSSDNATWF